MRTASLKNNKPETSAPRINSNEFQLGCGQNNANAMAEGPQSDSISQTENQQRPMHLTLPRILEVAQYWSPYWMQKLEGWIKQKYLKYIQTPWQS